jgi:hypothetical protein
MTAVRVATHVHSEWSYDGHWGLADLAGAFRRRGYRAVLLAEHDRGFDDATWAAYQEACVAASTSEIVLVPGIEYSDPTNTIHVPVWGAAPFLGEGVETGELLRRAQAAGGMATIAHPKRRDALSRIEPDWLGRLFGIELWNRKYDGIAPNRAVADLLHARPGLVPMVSLDFHTAKQFHPLAMVVDLEGAATAEGVIAALRQRRLRPTAYRLPALTLTRGAAWPAVCGMERARKELAVQYRRVRQSRAVAPRRS